MAPPEPSDRASAIVAAVEGHVDLDLAPIRAAVAEGLAEPSSEFVCERAEALAGAAIAARWPEELVEECRSGLAEAHDSFLLTASKCLEAAQDLDANGGDSWIALAVRHRLAFDAAWDALAESERVTPIEWCIGDAHDHDAKEAPIEPSQR